MLALVELSMRAAVCFLRAMKRGLRWIFLDEWYNFLVLFVILAFHHQQYFLSSLGKWTLKPLHQEALMSFYCLFLYLCWNPRLLLTRLKEYTDFPHTASRGASRVHPTAGTESCFRVTRALSPFFPSASGASKELSPCTGKPKVEPELMWSPTFAIGSGMTFMSQISCLCWMQGLLGPRTLRFFGITCRKYGVRLSRWVHMEGPGLRHGDASIDQGGGPTVLPSLWFVFRGTGWQ